MLRLMIGLLTCLWCLPMDATEPCCKRKVCHITLGHACPISDAQIVVDVCGNEPVLTCDGAATAAMMLNVGIESGVRRFMIEVANACKLGDGSQIPEAAKAPYRGPNRQLYTNRTNDSGSEVHQFMAPDPGDGACLFRRLRGFFQRRQPLRLLWRNRIADGDLCPIC